MDGVTADGVTTGDNVIDEELLSTAINNVARTMTSLKTSSAKTTSSGTTNSIQFFTRKSFLQDLFEVQIGMLGTSVEELMEKYPYMPLFVIFALLTADTKEESVETTMTIIQSQQKQQKVISQSIIDDTNYMQKQREELAASDADDAWMSRVGIDVTGANRKEDSKTHGWLLAIGLIVLVVVVVAVVAVSVASGGALAVPAIAIGAAVIGTLIAIGSICSMIANVVTNPKHKKNLMLAASIINPIQAVVEGSIDAHCELNDIDPNDEKIRKARMWTNLAATIVASIVLVIVGILTSAYTGGASGAAAVALAVANIMNIVTAIMSGVTAIATGSLEIRNGQRALERAEMRKMLNQIQASIERMKSILDMIGINIELWTEIFSNDMTIIRGEYDRAARMLKEYNDQKGAIARNIRA